MFELLSARSRPTLVAIAALAIACSPAMLPSRPEARGTSPAPATAPASGPRTAHSAALAEGLRVAERYRVPAIATRRFTHEEFWRAVAPSVSSAALRTEEIGRSINGREIRSVTFGQGPTKVLLWSQMHGDESTATMSLADIFRFLAEAEGDARRERLRSQLTIVFVPMLNPDGAELFQRENALGVDVNRDARQLATPEAQTLKGLRDRFRPDFGFNLHDQGARTRVGPRGLPAAIALLAPPFDESRSYNDVRTRARLVAATIASTLQGDIPGRIAKYDDSFNPRAFGDLMQQWGTSTVLIESGGIPGDPQKQRLRALNVAGILAALDAIATRSYESANPAVYDSLPYNTGGASDLLIVGGQVVLPGKPPMRADIAINYDDAVARTGGRVRDVGDLRTTVAIDTVDAQGLFVHPTASAITSAQGSVWLRLGAPAELELRRSADPASEVVRRIGRSAEPSPR